MMLAEKHIRHYNRLNGKLITKKGLSAFHAALKKDIDSKRIDIHAPLGVECVDIEKRLSKAISMMNGNAMVVNCKVVNVEKVMSMQKLKEATKPKQKPASKQPAHKPKVVKVEPAPRVEKEREPVKRKKVMVVTGKLHGLLSADQIAAMNFTKIDLGEPYKSVFLIIYSDTQIMVWGQPGSGKTVYLLKFAQYLAEKKNLRVLYLANEELGRSTFTKKIREFKIGHKNLSFARSLRELERTGHSVQEFDVVFFDSVQSIGMDLQTYKKFVEENPGRIYIPIVQSTKDGDFRGGKDWEHEVDIAGEIVNRKLILRKNRLDADFAKKAEKLMIDEMISEKKKKKLINDSIKGKSEEQKVNQKS